MHGVLCYLLNNEDVEFNHVQVFLTTSSFENKPVKRLSMINFLASATALDDLSF